MPEFERLTASAHDVGGPADVIQARPGFWSGIPSATALLAMLVLLLTASSPVATQGRPATGSGGLLADAPTRLVVPRQTLDLPGEITSFDVGAGGYAVVVSEDCRHGPPCVGGLATSHDLRYWREHPLPPGAMRQGAPVPLVLGTGVVLLQNFGYRYQSWLSRDSGRSWRVVPDAPERSVEVAAGRVAADPLDQLVAAPCGAHRLVVHRRDTGQRAWLRHQPTGIWPCTATPFPDQDGRLWIAGIAAPTGRYAAVALSTDSGRHWRTTRLPGTAGASRASITFAGRQVYAMVAGEDPGSPFSSLRAIFRYSESGWTRVWRPNGSEPPGLTLVTVCPGGVWLSTSERPGRAGRTLFSSDGGDTWSAAAGLPQIRATSVPGHGWFGWYHGVGWARPVHSQNCQVWRELPVG